MPAPSPNSRKTSSSVVPRNLAGSPRGDLPSPTRGLLQATSSSSNLSANRSLYERIDDHKENNSESGNSRGPQGRSNQNLRGASKKRWVTHFSKPAATLCSSNRILVDRNSSPSSLRSGGVIQGNAEALGDPKVRSTPPKVECEEACATPGPVKGVADLSKSIQQFLEEQDVLLGIKAGSAQEVVSVTNSVTPVDVRQRSVSSPYNPYKSPFSERPKFLRLNGTSTVSTLDDELGGVSSSTNVADAAMEEAIEELPIFEGGQVLDTPMHPIQFCNDLSPSSVEDKDVKAHREELEEKLVETTLEEAPVYALQKMIQLVPENKPSEGSPSFAESVTKTLDLVGAEPRKKQSPDGNVEVETVHLKEDGIVYKAKAHSALEGLASQSEREENGACEAENESQPRHMASQSQAADMKLSQGKEVVAGLAYEDLDDVQVEVLWGKRAGRMMFCGALLSLFVCLVFLSSAGPGLLPSALVNNPVQSSWHSSKYHKSSMSFVRGMEGLWSTHSVYIPVDVRAAVGRGEKMLHSFSRLSDQLHANLQVYSDLTSSILEDWRKGLFQYILLRNGPSLHLNQEEHGRQFEWLQEYEFEEWLDETPNLQAYTDWELLHEYDLEAANQFVLGSISEVLKHDLRRNFSRLTNSPEVKGLLEELMNLKGGNTQEDRLEVLQYFWEYTRFTASARETLMQSQAAHISVEKGSPHQASSGQEQLVGEIHSATDEPDCAMLVRVDFPEEQSTNGPIYAEDQQDPHTEHGTPNNQYLMEKAEVESSISTTGGQYSHILSSEPEDQSADKPDLSIGLENYLAEDSKLIKEAELLSARFEQEEGIERKLSDMAIHSGTDEPDCAMLLRVDFPEEQSTNGPISVKDQQDLHTEHGTPNDQYLMEKAEAASSITTTGGQYSHTLSSEPEDQSADKPDLSIGLENYPLAEDSKLIKEAELLSAGFEQEEGIEKKLSDMTLEVIWTPKELQASHLPTVSENAGGSTEELKSELADMLNANMQLTFDAQIGTLAMFLVASMFILAHSRRPKSAVKLASPVSTNVQFLRKTDQLQVNMDNGGEERESFLDSEQDRQQVTLIEEMNDEFASVLRSPEPNVVSLQSLQSRRDEDDFLRSPIPASTSSPYGSFTTYKLMQGQAAGDTKLTPVRRSSRIRNNSSMSPQPTAVKRIAISPP
ncbi:hypothetical protein L7F22_015690 [Adiantum nelumboides]|nr:hypothetical protein [Adiantum nelumboides]